MTFEDFFQRATGHPCYAYQEGLAEAISWPDALIAPTGLGKTAAVVLAWLWRRLGMPNQTPRRLIYCLPMRTLVEQTAECIHSWLDALGRRAPIEHTDVHVLMGGFDESRWYVTPERAAILVGTQDLLLSRALMRGYAMSRYRWPVDFALVHNDSQWVLDEVQLMDSGLATSTQLEGLRRKLLCEAPSHSLWVSATLHPLWLRTVDLPDVKTYWRIPDRFPLDVQSSRVRNLVDAPKTVDKSAVGFIGTKVVDVDRYAAALASEVLRKHLRGRTTLVVLNTVARARAVHEKLTRLVDSSSLALIHSRFRPTDRRMQMGKLPSPREQRDLIIVATQAIEAGVDLSASTLFAELAPLPSMIQRFGRVNRYGEFNSSGGGSIFWIDILANRMSAKEASVSSIPYDPDDIKRSRRVLTALSNASPSSLASPRPEDFSHQAVIRRKDLLDLYDTDPDLTGFDVDVSQYIRESSDTDVRVFWRDFDLSKGPISEPPPSHDELCAIPISGARAWFAQLRKKKIRPFRIDPQSSKAHSRRKPPWIPLDGEPWPGLLLLMHGSAGGYTPEQGFDPKSKRNVQQVLVKPDRSALRVAIESNESDSDSEKNGFVPLTSHLRHVVQETERLCDTFHLDAELRDALLEAARWHDVGKAHPAFQERLVGRDGDVAVPNHVLAKAPRYDLSKGRAYFRHELASTLAYMAQSNWSRDADLVAYLVAAHHGKVRMNLRAYPAETAPRDTDGRPDGRRFARGVWDGDAVPAVDNGLGETWQGGMLRLSVMELGEHPTSGASWSERTRGLLAKYGPFRLAWLEALVRVADWRASASE